MMSYLEDSHDFKSFDLELPQGPPLIKKTSWLIAAVVQNQVDVLKDLLDSPEWYNVTDKDGYSLLQIAILRDNEEVFDYMMSLPDFPLEFVNRKGQTALGVSLCDYVRKDVSMSEHFSFELLKKGACIDIVCYDDNTPLSCALERSYIKVAKLLMEAGVDVNVANKKGETPLDMAFVSKDTNEAVTALLMYGTEPSFPYIETAVQCNLPFIVQESLFLHLCDEHSEVEISLSVLLELAETQSPLFLEIIKFPIEVRVNNDNVDIYCQALCSISIDYLKMVIENFEPYISEVFAIRNKYYIDDHGSRFFERHSSTSFYNISGFSKAISVENLNMMLQNNVLRSDVMTFINTLNSTRLFKELIDVGCGESIIEELYCFLLSYGLPCQEMDLQLVYQKFGYCEFFKILLHMDFKCFELRFKKPPAPLDGYIKRCCFFQNREFRVKHTMPIFIYDVNMNLEIFLASPYGYEDITRIDELFGYFTHPKLTKIYEYEQPYRNKTRKNLPPIPLLTELSRNAFRKFFIETFQITTSRKFFTLLNCLPISTTHKKIITYETELY